MKSSSYTNIRKSVIVHNLHLKAIRNLVSFLFSPIPIFKMNVLLLVSIDKHIVGIFL